RISDDAEQLRPGITDPDKERDR
ncbi:hypothetical protein LCGC14_2656700, partial [marine sediment metagenome]